MVSTSLRGSNSSSSRAMQMIYPILMIVILETHGQNNCEWGKYGENCSKDCPLNCIPDPRRHLTHCHKETGKCSEGCVPGWFEDLCDHACSKNCLRNTCNRQNGICTFGCDGDYTGDFCNSIRGTTALPPRESSTYTSPTTPSESNTEKTPGLAAILVPVFLILVVVLAVVVIILRKRKRGETTGIIDAVTGILPCWRTTGTDGTTARAGEDEPFMAEEGGATTRGDASSISSFVLFEDDDFPPGSIEQKIKDIQGVFVKTESFKKAKEKLETFGHVTLSGAPGAGKTAMALMLGAEYRKQGYELVLVEHAYKVKLSEYLDKGKDVCVIFDDVLKTVRSYLDMSRLKHVLYDLHMHLEQCESGSERRYQRLQQEPGEEQGKLEQPNICVIFTVDTNNLQRAMSKLGGQHIFKSSSDVKLSCTQEEKKELWQKYKHRYGYKVDVKNVFAYTETTVGFPLECKLFSSCCGFQMHHDSFFEKPLFYITNQLRTIISSLDDKSAALILILLCEGQIDTSQLETECSIPDGQLTTKDDRPDSQLETKADHPDSKLKTKGGSPNSQLKTKGGSPNSQLKTKGGSPNSQLDTEGVCPISQLETEAVRPDIQHGTEAVRPVTQLETKADSPDNQLETEAVRPIIQRETEGVRPVTQFDTKADSPDNQLETEAVRPNIQRETEGVRPVSQLKTKGGSPDSQLATEGACISQLENEGARPNLEAHLKAVATLVKTSTSQGVAEAVRGFCGTLLTKGNITSFSHSIIYDVCALVLFNIEPHFILKHCSINFLLEHVHDQQDDRIPVNENQLRIPFSEAFSEIIADRMADAIVSGAFSMYIWHPIWKRKDISDKVNHMITDPPSLSDVTRHNLLYYACFTGNKNILERLLPHCDINRRGLNGWTPLMYAVVSGQMECFDILVKNKAGMAFCDINNNNLLHLACKHGYMSTVKHVKNVLKEHLSPDLYLKRYINGRGENDWTPVMCAVAFGKEDIIDYLTYEKNSIGLKKELKSDFKLSDINTNTVLHLACRFGNKSTVESLLPHTDINARGNNGQTPLMCALFSERKETFDLLVSMKADITMTDDDNNSLLHLSCHVDDASLVVPIVPNVDINRRGKHGWTPLMKAAVHGNMDVFQLFLYTVKVDLKLKDENNNNLLHLACHGGHVSIVQQLLPKFKINSRGNNGRTPVMCAAASGVESVFNLLVSEGADIRLRDDNNNSLLHLACFGGNISIVTYLLPKSDINCQGSHGRTAIMITVLVGKPALFKLLLSKKANIKLTDDDNNTVLHHACQGGNYSIVNYLMSKFGIDTSGKHGWTPVMFAAWAGRKVVFDLLVKQGADLTLTDAFNDNVLHLACQSGSTDIVEYLVTPSDVSLRGKNDSIPEMHAARSVSSGNKDPCDGNAPKDVIQSSTSPENHNAIYMVSHSGKEAIVKQVSGYFDINVRGRDDQTPLMRAVCGGHIAVFRFLVSRGADQTLVDKDGHTLLHLSTQHGQLHMVKYIIDSFDINAKDKVGLTPVMTSILYAKVAVFEYLREKDADLSLVNNAGDTLVTLAHKIGCRQIIEQLPPSKNVKRLSGQKDSHPGKSQKRNPKMNRKSHN
ncbi:uncharacterized protein LOC124117625 isoform X2 [Haliotis rufescens]|uniref:uncharacterized protein LOC124117625 isoform X2 n=1 Tax=Haliotis rufescens TaxID=6454 RepID=UPI00201EC487|nr:uncharacterized protein LOC124117625 isoform X2 [Haliotis rufescens]